MFSLDDDITMLTTDEIEFAFKVSGLNVLSYFTVFTLSSHMCFTCTCTCMFYMYMYVFICMLSMYIYYIKVTVDVRTHK